MTTFNGYLLWVGKKKTNIKKVPGLPHCPRAAIVCFSQTKPFRPSENTSGPVPLLLPLQWGIYRLLYSDDSRRLFHMPFPPSSSYQHTILISRSWNAAAQLHPQPQQTPTTRQPAHPLRHRTGFQVEYCISLKWTSTVYPKLWTNVHKKSSHCKADWTLYVLLVAPSGPSVIECY